MHLIDVHMIVYDEPQWQVDRMLESLSKEPVNVHIVEGQEEMPPFKGRTKGFSMGNAPYVSYVDPDDEIIPGAFQKLLDAIKSGDYDAAYGYENAWDGGLVQTNFLPHHAYLIKSNLGIDYSQEFRVLLNGAIPHERTICVEETLYLWRRD